MLPLKYNTASQTIILGPFLDDTDGRTAETGLSITNTDIKLNKHNGTTFVNKNSGGATHIANGYYYTTLDATDTNTIGRLVIAVNMTGALPVWHEYTVYPANVYDSLFVGSSKLEVNTVQLSGTTQTARDLGAQCDVTISSRAPETGGNIAAIKAKTDQLTFTTANKVDATIQAGADFAQAAADKVWASTTRALTDKAGFSLANNAVDAAQFTQAAADKVWSSTTRSLTDKSDFALSASSRAAIVDEVWDESRSGHTTAGTFGEGVASVQGNVTGSVNSVVSGVTVSTNNDKTGYSLANDAVGAAQFTQAAADKVWSSTTRSLTDKSDFSLSAASRAAIVDEVWDELRSGHTATGTFGQGVASVQGNVTGSVNSVVSGVTVSTNNDKTGYSLANNAVDAAQFTQAAADKIWSSATRSLTDKSDFALSAASRAAIWDETGTLGISFETLIQRSYQMINNRMLVNESDGSVTLRNIGNTSTIATGSVTSSSGQTTRAELAWA